MSLSSMLGLSSSDAANEAAQKNTALAQMYGTQSTGQIGDYQTGATGALSGGLTSATGAVNTGTGQAAGAFGSAVNAYNPLSSLGNQYGGAVNAYYNALGLNGPEGNAAAVSQFQTSPGYQFLQDEAMRGIVNNASRFGATGGNTLTALQGRAGDLANQQWSDYLNRLQGFAPLQLQATQGAAAGQAAGYGQLGNLYSDQGKTLAGLYTGEAGDVANVLGNVVQSQLGVGRDVLGANTAANNMVAQSAMQDAANRWGAINAGIGAIGNVFGGGKKVA